jgi:hypothetical protein
MVNRNHILKGENMMKRKTFLICAAILPFMLFMAGCGGGGYAEEEYNPNAQHIYVHQENDPVYDMYMLQQMQRQNLLDSQESTDRLIRGMDESTRRMGQTQKNIFGVLENARIQQNLYNQQRQPHFGR